MLKKYSYYKSYDYLDDSYINRMNNYFNPYEYNIESNIKDNINSDIKASKSKSHIDRKINNIKK